jgi:hypothetical protein
MSDTPTITAPAPRPFFKPWTLLLGFVAGLVLLSVAGRTLIKRDLHPTAVRFHPMIAPDSQYEPTMGEMRAFVRARCRPDQRASRAAWLQSTWNNRTVERYC